MPSATLTKTSAAGALALLAESEPAIQSYALSQLNDLVDVFWPEISDNVTKMLASSFLMSLNIISEVLCEDEAFASRKLAALVVSKVYYHLGEYEESLNFALGADTLFDLSLRTEFVETLICICTFHFVAYRLAKCIDQYISLRTEHERSKNIVTIDPRLESVVERMFERCLSDSEYKQAIGIALESRRLDILEKSILKGDSRSLLKSVLEISMVSIEHLDFRSEVLRLLTNLYQNLPEPDYFSIIQCQMHLDDVSGTADLLKKLVQTNDYHTLIAYQLSFDLEANATQEYLQKVLMLLPAPITSEAPVAALSANGLPIETGALLSNTPIDPQATAFTKIRSILTGELSIKLNLQFLSKNNHADLLYLKKSKLLESKSSMFHSAITFSNAFMNAGTTCDEFLRDNLQWLALANNWSKFSATVALGVIHRGQIEHGKSLLAPYLPRDGVSGSPYSEGGALYALGLIHTSHGHGIIDYLTQSLKATQNEVVQHGASLGLGVAGMASDNQGVYADLKEVLYTDSATSGEAAGLAMGLIMLGTASETSIQEMLQYAHDTKHEKIIRSLALGVSLIVYGKEDQADVIIDRMATDQDALIRYGGMYAVAFAYAGTGNNKAIRKLLHVAVSDVNDDVRRAAVTALGFLLFKTPEKVPKLVQLLSESYNPYVRYGATQALGIACAGTGLSAAVEILEPLTKDNVGFVKQGALIALAMLFMQHNEVQSPKVATIRGIYDKIVADKYEDAPSKFGATIAQGILDAGGRNVTISLKSRSGYPNMRAIVGMAMFMQHWYWFPLTHMLSLAFTPTAIIGLNKNLDVPEFEFLSAVRPSLFAYPAPTKPPVVETIEMVATAVLSTTAKSIARAKRKEGDSMDTDDKTPDSAVVPEIKTEEKKVEEVEKKTLKKKKEEEFQLLNNLTRVTPNQLQFIKMTEKSRYVPVKKGPEALYGIVILQDTTPDIEEKIMNFAPAVEEVGAVDAPAGATETPVSAVLGTADAEEDRMVE